MAYRVLQGLGLGLRGYGLGLYSLGFKGLRLRNLQGLGFYRVSG